MGAFALVQLSRLDGFLAGTRPIKQGVYKAVEGTLCPAPQNDAEGDCGTTLHFQFDTAEAAIRFERLQDERDVYASRPIDSGRHVYSNCNTKPFRFREKCLVRHVADDVVGRELLVLHPCLDFPVKSNDNVTEAGSFCQKIMLPACALLSVVLVI